MRGPFVLSSGSALMVALSWCAAVVACLAYGTASVLQSEGAKRTRRAAGAGGLALILLQLPYLAGLAADVVAFVANVVALQQLPLFLVQTVVTASVGVTAVLASIRGDRLRPRDWISLAVLGVGLVLLCLTASTEAAVQIARPVQWAILLAALVPLLLGAGGLRLPDRAASLVLAAAAGTAWTGVAISARGLSADHVSWGLLTQPLVWAIPVQGVIGTAFFALALQRGRVTAVTAVTFMLEMVVPSLVGLWLFGDAVSAGQVPWAVLGFVLAGVGAVSLMRYAA